MNIGMNNFDIKTSEILIFLALRNNSVTMGLNF